MIAHQAENLSEWWLCSGEKGGDEQSEMSRRAYCGAVKIDCPGETLRDRLLQSLDAKVITVSPSQVKRISTSSMF